MKTQLRLLTQLINPRKGPVSLTASQNVRFEDVTDYLDELCENMSMCLDRTKSSGNDLSVTVAKRNLNVDITNQDVISRNDDSRKPQLYFETRPDNSDVGFLVISAALYSNHKKEAERKEGAQCGHNQG